MAQKITPTRRRLASIASAAEYCDVSPRTVRRWIASGLLPAFRVGPHLLRVDMNDVDKVTRRVPTAGGDAA